MALTQDLSSTITLCVNSHVCVHYMAGVCGCMWGGGEGGKGNNINADSEFSDDYPCWQPFLYNYSSYGRHMREHVSV